ncbi:unnamed protein product [Phyllotreta striolata]|uniref:AIMP2 thioredoxin-like domain-containing protein n=1 Tax=Phyllotreta striolata TaxID=444603 RepID=A0A9N9XU59_PHYSR|nr:unnamed protein product [Phyllotreta striolata]
MASQTKMYRTSRIIEHDLTVPLPKCMYPLKNIHSKDTGKEMAQERPDHVSTCDRTPAISDQVKQFLKNNQHVEGMADLLTKQEKILKQLQELRGQIESIKVDLKVDPTKTSNPTLNTPITNKQVIGDISDIVVNADPLYPPYSLEIVQKLIHNTINLRVTCHVHSSVSELPENARALEETLSNYQHEDKLPDLHVRLIWKNVGVDAEFVVTRYTLRGEVNLLRYVGRVVPSLLSYDSDPDSVEIDSILDMCYLFTRTKTKTERSGYVTALGKLLGKDWIAHRGTVSVADLAAYSAVRQHFKQNEMPAKLTKWFEMVGTVNMLRHKV